ncbi:MAG: 4Fe-4S binding protein, partial [Eggerthellaceae bacterium]|nr:4Fe-4S binding protein [Eggerthellaceae bacterium]
MKVTIVRRIVLILVVLSVLISFFVNTGSGNLSSLGWDAIAYICPLGALEAFVSSWTLVPRQVVAVVICVAAVILLGKVFCSWLCPVPPLRKFFTFKHREVVKEAHEEARKGIEQQGNGKALHPSSKAIAPLSGEEASALKASCSSEGAKGCSSCAEQRKKFDSRHVVLIGALLSSAIFGFPVFCIICPVGLTFASLIALWRLVGFNEPSWALLIYPAFLAIELFVLKKWCIKFCPLGALMSLMSIPNKFFKPHVDEAKCLHAQGIECKICTSVCEEELDPHSPAGMHECTKCGACKDHCPAHAITIPFYTPKQKEL